MCGSVDFSRNANNGCDLGIAILGMSVMAPLNTIVKIGATVASFFECLMPDETAGKIHNYALRGALPISHEWFGLTQLGSWPVVVYEFLLNFIPTIDVEDLVEKLETAPSLGNQLQCYLFGKASQLFEDDSKALSRLLFLVSTPIIMVAKIGQLALGILAAALSLVTLGGFCGYGEKLNLFALRNLQADILDTLCSGLRYTFDPENLKFDDRTLNH